MVEFNTNAISDCDIFVIIVTRSALDRQYIKEEVELSKKLQKGLYFNGLSILIPDIKETTTTTNLSLIPSREL